MNKKKIVLYITSMHRGGAERVMSILANYFANEGHDVVLATDVVVRHDEENYKISEKIKCVHINPKSKNFLIKNIERIRQIRKLIKKEHADVVLSFLGKQNIRMLIATIGLKCRKCISVRNDPKMEYGQTRVKKTIANLIIGMADLCVFQTSDAKKYFNKKIQNRSVIIRNPIDDKFFKIGRPAVVKNIVTVGRLEPQKNHKLLIDAFYAINESISGEKLLIYGKGSLKKELKEYIGKLGMSDRILLMGETSNVERELAKAKVFVLSSDYEGMPNALMEAMAVGLTCISTDCPCGGPKELIEDGKNGFLVPRGDSVRMSEKILLAVNGPDVSIIAKSAKISMEQYNMVDVLKKWNLNVFKGKD